MSESRQGVVASGEIPSGAKSPPFNYSTLSRKINLEKIITPLQVGLNQNGEICTNASTDKMMSSSSRVIESGNSSSSWFWIKLIEFAPDCHVQNVRICRWQTDVLILQATKTIGEGQKLFLWFGEDVLVNDLGIPPYLSPLNIRGGKNYTCHKCGMEFEAPNPLKLHLALSCGSLSIDIIWDRMGSLRKFNPSPLNLRIGPTSSPALIPHPFPVIRPHTFFLPIHSLNSSSSQVSSSTCSSFLQQRPLLLPQLLTNTTKNQRSSSLTEVVVVPSVHAKSLSDQQAQLESIMSNMGRGKNGDHVCVYCGKLYSRKYGLKIHIRTHTGFKPLQCKICHRPFGDPSNLNKHVRLHSDGNTPYRCEICGKVLVRRRDLDRHIRSRHSASLNIPTQQSAIDCSISRHNSNNNNNTGSNNGNTIAPDTLINSTL